MTNEVICPVEGCDQKCSDGHLMCRGHWYGVDKVLREKIWRALTHYQRRSSRENLLRLRELQGQAIAAAQQKTAVKA